MSIPAIREFRLASPGSKRGVCCDANGIFVCGVPLLKRVSEGNGEAEWNPRECGKISSELSNVFGLPIDVSSKSAGLAALARDLNASDISHAQLVALHMEFPEKQPPPNAPGHSRESFIKLIHMLHASRLLKADWNPDEHPRWPAGSPDSQGGQFAPSDEGSGDSEAFSTGKLLTENAYAANGASDAGDHVADDFDHGAKSPAPIDAVAHGDEDGQLDEVAYQGYFHDFVVNMVAENLRQRGFKVETELPMVMADGSGATRVDLLFRGKYGIVAGLEVKTGDDPRATDDQLLVYAHMLMGGSVISTSPRIAAFEFPPGVPLPPIPVGMMYARDPDSELQVFDLDPQKMLERLRLRLLGRRSKK